jgi:hypothetical protein
MITHDNGDIDYKALGDFLIKYENKLKGWEDTLKIDGKNIANALIEQDSWAAYYDQIRVDLDTLLTYFDIKLDEREEEIYTSIKQQSGYNHSETAIKRLISGNKKYIELRRLRLEISELRERADVVGKQFRQRSYTLNNYLKMIELEAQDIIMSI